MEKITFKTPFMPGDTVWCIIKGTDYREEGVCKMKVETVTYKAHKKTYHLYIDARDESAFIGDMPASCDRKNLMFKTEQEAQGRFDAIKKAKKKMETLSDDLFYCAR